jgi:uncharacterized protein (TIGR02246 family)
MTTPEETRSELDSDAVRNLELEYDDAWNSGDIGRIMDCFAEGAVVVNPRGEVAVGVDAIRNNISEFLTGAALGSRHSSQLSRLSFVTPDVAVVDGEARLEGVSDVGTIHHGFTDILVRNGGRWFIAHVRAYESTTGV